MLQFCHYGRGLGGAVWEGVVAVGAAPDGAGAAEAGQAEGQGLRAKTVIGTGKVCLKGVKRYRNAEKDDNRMEVPAN